jgi:hypothetical protein
LGSNMNYQFAFAVKSKGDLRPTYETGDYLRIPNGFTVNALRDVEREDRFRDREAALRFIRARGMTPASNHFIHFLWFKETEHWRIMRDHPTLSMNGEEAIQAFGDRGMRLIQRAFIHFLPQHADRVRLWDESAYAAEIMKAGMVPRPEIKNRFVLDYLRAVHLSRLEESLTAEVRQRLFFSIPERFSIKNDHMFAAWKRLWAVSLESGGSHWFYLIGRFPSDPSLDSPQVLLSEILETMRRYYGERPWTVFPILAGPARGSSENPAITLGHSGITVIRVTPHRGRLLRPAA